MSQRLTSAAQFYIRGTLRKPGAALALAAGLTAFFTAISLFAGEGGNVSGGGGAIILPDDSVVISDPYTPRVGSDSVGELAIPLQAELGLIGELLVGYGASYLNTPDSLSASRQTLRISSSFIYEHVLNPLIEFRFVPQLPLTTECQTPHHVVAVDGRLENVACTMGLFTWIRSDLFSRMILREQALLIVHERLHASPLPLPEEAVADITDGVRVILTRFNSQITGDRTALRDDELHRIEILRRRIAQAGLMQGRVHERSPSNWLTEWRAWPNGGGLVRNTVVIAPTAFISIGSLVGDGRIDSGAEILNSLCYDLLYESDSRISMRCQIGSGARLQNTRLSIMGGWSIPPSSTLGSLISIGENAQIINSLILVSGERASRDSNAVLSLGRGSIIQNTTLQGLDVIRIQEGSRLTNVNFFGALHIFPETSGYRPNVSLLMEHGTLLHGINRYFPSWLTATSAEAVLQIMPNTLLDFTGRDACGAATLREGSPLNLLLNSRLQVTSEQEFAAACAN